jgi:ABC-type multidrug transport system ATPase subunit
MVEQLNLAFDKICYHVHSSHFYKKRKSKQILNEISGEFCSNELTAIIGASGSGKSSLLDILSGFRSTSRDVTGSIKINENIVATKIVRKMSSYVMQVSKLHEFLTVSETMMFAENFKSKKDQRECNKNENILKSLNMRDKLETLVKHLSGGEQKRLSIAIELVDDPLLIFLDEPTTGLDSSSSMQCIQILKKLAHEGKTIICTVHSPSSSMLKHFDHIYALAEGNCIYQGSVDNIVPFLSELDLICPENYSPSDFLLEIATNDYGEQNHLLTEKIQNGSNFGFRQKSTKLHNNFTYIKNSSRSIYLLSFVQQVKQLLHRNFLISTRDKTLVTMRLMIHIIFG